MPKPSIPAYIVSSTLLLSRVVAAQSPTPAPHTIIVVPAPVTAPVTAPASAPTAAPVAPAPAVVVPAPPAVVVDVAQNAHVVDAAAVRAAIGRELQRPAVAPEAMEARTAQGRLTIALDPDHRIVMIYRDSSGREVLRAVAMPSDPAAALAMITLLAGNLARNEAADLARSLAPAAPPPPPAPVAPPPPAPMAIAQPIVIYVTSAGAIAQPAPVAPMAPVAPASPIVPAAAPRRAPRDARAPGEGSNWYDERHGGRFGVYGGVAAGLSVGPALWGFNAGLAYRWRHVSLGLDLNYASSGDGSYSSESRWWASPVLTVFTGAGPVRFEGGVGFGLMYRGADSWGGYGWYNQTFLLPVARLITQVSVALTTGFDLYARGEIASTIPTEYGGVIAMASLGVQGRLFR